MKRKVELTGEEMTLIDVYLSQHIGALKRVHTKDKMFQKSIEETIKVANQILEKIK